MHLIVGPHQVGSDSSAEILTHQRTSSNYQALFLQQYLGSRSAILFQINTLRHDGFSIIPVFCGHRRNELCDISYPLAALFILPDSKHYVIVRQTSFSSARLSYTFVNMEPNYRGSHPLCFVSYLGQLRMSMFFESVKNQE